jgi:hypothetical protein
MCKTHSDRTFKSGDYRRVPVEIKLGHYLFFDPWRCQCLNKCVVWPGGQGVRAHSTLRLEVKSLPRAPEVLIKEVTIARTVMRALHRNLEEFPGNQKASWRPGDCCRREADSSLRSDDN